MYQHFGIDYGSKLAGTTVCCWFTGEKFELLQSAKNQDADQFLLELCNDKPVQLYIDAPLSLPGVYRNLPGYSDYFYREADKTVRAMSPMFLGGLTARAMQLQAKLQETTTCIEVYPGAMARSLQLHEAGYKKEHDKLKACFARLIGQLDWPSDLQEAAERLFFANWHQFDAFLAWCIGWKVQQQSASVAGNQTEGMIFY